MSNFTQEEIIMFEKMAIELEINEAKKQLEDTDYKVVKNEEYAQAGLPLAYNPVELHRERQLLRDKINELEKLQSG